MNDRFCRDPRLSTAADHLADECRASPDEGHVSGVSGVPGVPIGEDFQYDFKGAPPARQA
jgi:hypothetical protein